MDREKLKQAAALILEAVGQDGRDGTKETPERFAKMMEERLAYAGVSNEEIAKEFDKVFPCDDGNMVVVKDIDVFSFCEHHIALMYDMKIAIGYRRLPASSAAGTHRRRYIRRAAAHRQDRRHHRLHSGRAFLHDGPGHQEAGLPDADLVCRRRL